MIKSYNQFWEELTPAYPVTKGKCKIPIATQLENFHHVNIEKTINDLDSIMQKIFTKEKEARVLADTWYERWFTHLYEGHYTGVVRFDCMFDQNNQLKVVEANTNRPDGLLMHDITYSALSWTKNTKHMDLFLTFFDKAEYIFILYEKWGLEDVHFLEYETLKKFWYKVWIWVFDDIVFKNGKALYDGNTIDVIRLSMNSWRCTMSEYAPLQSAKLRYVNTFDMAWFADKSLLTWVDHPMVMKTYILHHENKNLVLQNKNLFVIKPTNLNEWIWVYIGIDMDQTEREHLIETNIDNNYLAQEYITISPKKTALYQDGGILEDNYYYDFCPHLFYKNAKLIGVWHILVRYSNNKIVNVLRWGGIGYYQEG